MTKKINYILKVLFFTFFCCYYITSYAQIKNSHQLSESILRAYRPQLHPKDSITYTDFDKDGDPDVLRTKINGKNAIWIDDDDDMGFTAYEGDLDNDCLCIDRNNDGIYAGPEDLCVDWIDLNNDGKANLQCIILNGEEKERGRFNWKSDIMWFIDEEDDQNFGYIDWQILDLRCWEHEGYSNFYTDYHGNTSFTKMSVPGYRITNMEFSWENPFYFWDYDGDGLTEMTIRFVDSPIFKDNKATNNEQKDFENIPRERDVVFKGSIDHAAISFDLDNNNSTGNEFDLDMSLSFKGEGFEYKQKHGVLLKGIKVLNDADSLLYDARWRQIDQLIFPPREEAWNLLLNKGNWDECWFVFDEDDDCKRWERVELYEPVDFFKIGKKNGGLDNNPQADALGDRGEWDTDNSGKAQLYIGNFDGRLHLYGAEYGVWRIDQGAKSYQGYGGLYDRQDFERLQSVYQPFATVKYTDTDDNGFIDLIEYDLNGDGIFEDQLSYIKLGILDSCQIINTKEFSYNEFNQLFSTLADDMWKKALKINHLCDKAGINTNWYSHYKNPKSTWQKYNFGYWLNFYLYHDLRFWAAKDPSLQKKIDQAFVAGDWSILAEKLLN